MTQSGEFKQVCESVSLSVVSDSFCRQEYLSGLPCPPPGDLLDPGIEPGLLHCKWILYHLSYQGSLGDITDLVLQS